MPKPPRDITTRWTWAWRRKNLAEELDAMLGISARTHRVHMSPTHKPLNLVKVWVHLLVGSLEITIQLRPITITDWRPRGGSNA